MLRRSKASGKQQQKKLFYQKEQESGKTFNLGPSSAVSNWTGLAQGWLKNHMRSPVKIAAKIARKISTV